MKGKLTINIMHSGAELQPIYDALLQACHGHSTRAIEAALLAAYCTVSQAGSEFDEETKHRRMTRFISDGSLYLSTLLLSLRDMPLPELEQAEAQASLDQSRSAN